MGHLDAAERARLLSDRLDQLVDDLSFDPSHIEVNDGETFSELVYEDRVLTAITDDDAKAAGVARPELARRTRDRLVEIVTTSREEYSASAIAIGLGWTTLATLLLVILLWQVRRLHRRVQARAFTLGTRVCQPIAAPDWSRPGRRGSARWSTARSTRRPSRWPQRW